MRLNKYLALHTDLSRRKADEAIIGGRVEVNGVQAKPGDIVVEGDQVTLDANNITEDTKIQTILFNKPVGFVVSRDGQGSRTIYDLLPTELHNLKPVGRLDKDSSGLLLLTNDGNLANQLTHPRYEKLKIYEIELDKPLSPEDKSRIKLGVSLTDGSSKLDLTGSEQDWKIKMTEGRNRQIRRTFEALGYTVSKLHRTNFGEYDLGYLKPGEYVIA